MGRRYCEDNRDADRRQAGGQIGGENGAAWAERNGLSDGRLARNVALWQEQP